MVKLAEVIEVVDVVSVALFGGALASTGGWESQRYEAGLGLGWTTRTNPGGTQMLSIPHCLSSGMCLSRRDQCFWSAGTYHSKPCIMVMFSRVGSWTCSPMLTVLRYGEYMCADGLLGKKSGEKLRDMVLRKIEPQVGKVGKHDGRTG